MPVHPNFTPNQYQQFLALINSANTPMSSSLQGSETYMANVVSFSSTMAGIHSFFHTLMQRDFSYYVFSAKVVNRKAYDDHTWVMDTRATNLIVCFMHLLTTITAITQAMVQLPNGETTRVTHVGTVTLSSHLTFTNVLCVPFFAFNLLSVSTITQTQPTCLIFLSIFCFIQDLTCWRTIGVQAAHDSLLQCDNLSQPPNNSLVEFLSAHNLGLVFIAFSATTSPNQSSHIWYSRLGHPSNSNLQSLSHIFSFLKNSCNKDCTICPLAKQKRLPFPFNSKMCDCPFDLIHMDVWGHILLQL